MQEVALPRRFGPREAPEWCSAWAEVRDAAAPILLVLPAGSFLEPAGIVLLAAAVAARQERGLPTRFRSEDPEGDAFRYLQRIDFFQELGVELEEPFQRRPAEGRFVSLRRVLDQRAARGLGDELGDFLAAREPQLPPSVLRAARFAMEELGTNIVEHSGAPRTGFGAAQAWPGAGEHGRFQFAFADAGVGILESLQRNPELATRVQDDLDAIQLAVEQGFSGSTEPRRNMGLGLAFLRSVADLLGGDLYLLSGTGIYHRRSVAGQRTFQVRPCPAWQGVLVCLDAPAFPEGLAAT